MTGGYKVSVVPGVGAHWELGVVVVGAGRQGVLRPGQGVLRPGQGVLRPGQGGDVAGLAGGEGRDGAGQGGEELA